MINRRRRTSMRHCNEQQHIDMTTRLYGTYVFIAVASSAFSNSERDMHINDIWSCFMGLISECAKSVTSITI